VEAGVRGAEKVGEVVAVHVIPRPHINVDLVLPLGRTEQARAEMQ
ncbi:MAG: ethanolamine utilization protein EutM, partial [Chloroflexota bacterium]